MHWGGESTEKLLMKLISDIVVAWQVQSSLVVKFLLSDLMKTWNCNSDKSCSASLDSRNCWLCSYQIMCHVSWQSTCWTLPVLSWDNERAVVMRQCGVRVVVIWEQVRQETLMIGVWITRILSVIIHCLAHFITSQTIQTSVSHISHH